MAKKNEKATQVESEVKAENLPAVKGRQDIEQVEAGSIDDLKAWGDGGISSNDIIIPRILLQQPMSQMVTNDKAKFCDFRDSLTEELIGDINKPFKVIPFYMEKVWIEFNCSDPNEKKFLRVVPIDPTNENNPYNYEEEIDGKLVPCQRDRTMNFYVLRPEDIEKGGAMPYILSARRTSLAAGKKLASHMFVKNIRAGLNPAATIMEVSCSKVSNEKKQTYAVMDIKPAQMSSRDQVQAAFEWMKLVKSGKARAHEESYSDDAKVDSAEERNADVPKADGPSRF